MKNTMFRNCCKLIVKQYKSQTVWLSFHRELFNIVKVVRDTLRAMEEHKSKLDALRSHLAQGAIQAASGEYKGEGLYVAYLV